MNYNLTAVESPSPRNAGRGRHEAKRSAGEGRRYLHHLFNTPSSAFGTFSPARGGEGLSMKVRDSGQGRSSRARS